MRKIFLTLIFFIVFFNCKCAHIIILHDPLTAEEHNDLGVSYWNEKKLDAAEKEFKKAIAKNKFYYLAYYNLGTLFLIKNNYKKSKEYLYKAIIYKPEFADAYNNLAIVELKLKNSKRAFYFIQLALHNSEIDKHKYIDTLAYYYEEMSDLQQACKYYQQAIDLAPINEKNIYKNKYNSKCINKLTE